MAILGRRGLLFNAIPAWLGLAVVSFFLSDGSLSARAVFAALGLAVGAGLITTIVLSLLFGLGRFLPARARWGAWILLGLAAGLALADQLGAFVRLDAQYRGLAIMIIAACASGGLAAGVIAATFQPGRYGGLPLYLRLRRGLRIAFAVLLLGAAAVAVGLDRTVYPGLYPMGHLGLQLGAVLAVTLAGVAIKGALRIPLRVLPPRVSAALPRVSAALAAALILLPFFLIDEDEIVAVQQIDSSRPFPALSLDIMRTATDLDGDGFSSFLAGGDCAALDGDINPGARDLPDNGLDENCSGRDRRAQHRRSPEEVPVPEAPSPMNVVLITIDSVRADRLKLYGYRHGTMPHLTRWAKDATVFDRAYAVAPWTGIAVPALLRGVYPRRMTWRRYVETTKKRLLKHPVRKRHLRKGEEEKKTFLLASSSGPKPLAYWLRRRGMATAAVVNDGYSRMLTDLPGISEGFDTYEIVPDAKCKKQSGDRPAIDLAIARLASLKDREPYFIWVHLFGAHVGRFKIPKKYRKFSPKQENNYDDKLLYVDAELRRLLRVIEGGQRLPVAVFVSADHGEAISGKRMWHGSGLTEDVIRVPLLAKVPGVAARRVKQAVGTIDLAPTILALTKTPEPDMDGANLIRVVARKPVKRPYGLISDNWRISNKGKIYTDLTAVYNGRLKLQLNHRSGVQSLVDQRSPDRDRSNRLSSGAARRLRRRLKAYLEDSGGAISVE